MTKEYIECAALFKPEYIEIFDEACKDMIGAARNFEHSFVLLDGKIGY
jgi:hypothetical protein